MRFVCNLSGFVCFIDMKHSHHFSMKRQKKNRFTSSKDEELAKLVRTHGINWKPIAFEMGLSTRQVRDRYNNYIIRTPNHKPWTEDEDELLLKLHEDIGPKWFAMQEHFADRSNIECKNHYIKLMRAAKKGNKSQVTCQKQVPLPLINMKKTLDGAKKPEEDVSPLFDEQQERMEILWFDQTCCFEDGGYMEDDFFLWEKWKWIARTCFKE